MSSPSGRESTRSRVRARDNWTCQDCGFRRSVEEVERFNWSILGRKGRMKSLDVHHTKGQCGKKSRKYDKVADLTGMITLCHKCHYNRPEHKVQSPEWKLSHRQRTLKVPSEKHVEIFKMWSDGMTLRAIGKVFSVSHQRIHQIVKEM